MKKIFQSLTLLLVISGGLAGNIFGKEKVVIGEPTWHGGLAAAHVLKVVIESKLGDEVELRLSDEPSTFDGMDKGDGTFDVHPDFWMPNQAGLWDKYIAGKDSRKTVLVNKPYDALQALFVPKYVQEQYNVSSVKDLLKTDVAKLFDSDGDGKGEYWIGSQGWGSTNIEKVRAKSYGYVKNFDPLWSSLFSVGDLKDPTSLVIKLREPLDPLSQFLKQNFSSSTNELLNAYDTATVPKQSLQKALVKEFNQLLLGPSLFTQDRFAKVILNKQTQRLIKQSQGEEDLTHFNRLLLEDGYPNEIAKNQQREMSVLEFERKLKSAYRLKKPILFYHWTPEWIHAQFDLVMLRENPFSGFAMDSKKDDPKYNPRGCWKMYQPKERKTWYEDSHVDCAWPKTKVFIAYSSSLENRNPKVAKFLSQVVLNHSIITKWIFMLAVEKEDPLKLANDWVDKNSPIVNEWLRGI